MSNCFPSSKFINLCRLYYFTPVSHLLTKVFFMFLMDRQLAGTISMKSGWQQLLSALWVDRLRPFIFEPLPLLFWPSQEKPISYEIRPSNALYSLEVDCYCCYGYSLRYYASAWKKSNNNKNLAQLMKHTYGTVSAHLISLRAGWHLSITLNKPSTAQVDDDKYEPFCAFYKKQYGDAKRATRAKTLNDKKGTSTNGKWKMSAGTVRKITFRLEKVVRNMLKSTKHSKL